MNDNLLIWWLSQADCEALENSFYLVELIGEDGDVEEYRIDGLPPYVNEQFFSRVGRAGRGRLWVADALGLAPHFAIAWDDATTTGARKLGFDSYGGIVLRAEDKAAVIALPGFVTDTNLKLIGDDDPSAP